MADSPERAVPMVQDDSVTLSRQALADLLKAVIEEAKKPYRDEEALARKTKARERLRTQRDATNKEIRDRQNRCSHLREDGSSAIAWATQSDGITRGVCQHCNRLIVPQDKDYLHLIRIPDRSPGLQTLL